jgi:hypothetical protein
MKQSTQFKLNQKPLFPIQTSNLDSNQQLGLNLDYRALIPFKFTMLVILIMHQQFHFSTMNPLQYLSEGPVVHRNSYVFELSDIVCQGAVSTCREASAPTFFV